VTILSSQSSDSQQTAGIRPATRRGLRRLYGKRLALVSLLYLLLLAGGALAAERLTGFTADEIDLLARLQGSSQTHLLGTDESGRDVLTRLLVGARVSLIVGIGAAGLAVILGMAAGGVAGYWGGSLDVVITRVIDGMLSVPLFFLLLVVLSVFGSTLSNIILVIGLTSWMAVARVVRAEVLRARTHDYVLAARALGLHDGRILRRHVLPQAFPSIFVAGSIAVADAIMLEAALSFLGLGIQPPSPSWGNMLTNAQTYVWTRPLLAVWPGLAIISVVLSLSWLTEGIEQSLRT
jgi:peptide/nickel transport system permease protein